jgi:hypothetical protein
VRKRESEIKKDLAGGRKRERGRERDSKIEIERERKAKKEQSLKYYNF